MILQALNEYYERKKALGEIAADGFVEKRIDFLIELDADGKYLGITDLREARGKNLVGKAYHVPAIGKQAQKHTNSGTDANLLWDNSGFVLGAGDSSNKKFNSFLAAIQSHYPVRPPDVVAVLAFLEKGQPFDVLLQHEAHGEVLSTGAPVISFRVDGSHDPVFCADHVKNVLDGPPAEGAQVGICLVTGKSDIIDPTHPVIKGIPGGQTSGCSLVGFNARSFCSYGKKQSFNAPIGKNASSSYTKALQSLVHSDSNKVVMSDITMLSWAQRAEEPEVEEFESGFVFTFADSPKDDPDRGVSQIKALLESVKTGKYAKPMGDFYVLGVSPNSARLSVRYWDTGSIQLFAERIAQHFEDFSIVHGPNERDYLSISTILRATVFEYKLSNVPPNLAGEVIRSVVSGREYPTTLLMQTVRRIRAEQKVTRARASILKACINRELRMGSRSMKEVKKIEMGLDKENTNAAYRLGRLFAVLERVQEDALGPNINANICDRFYGAASSTPSTVFSRLLKLKIHHMAKLDPPKRVVREKLIGEIMNGISDFPARLTLNEQGLFAIGYYHQRQDFFTPKKERDASEANAPSDKED